MRLVLRPPVQLISRPLDLPAFLPQAVKYHFVKTRIVDGSIYPLPTEDTEFNKHSAKLCTYLQYANDLQT